uniref:Uncharacterized protein n=1 Tax=Chromera velia CCMP2878 TaxID=1169474 RepID=A0A0G4FV93_9ALVE|eukprot:Cvel_18932.t1-p1 / transcript=Cvel_18932.t1 / gene=Cvel_18932 / organism=Chromera_velia_CCMP2878 / gene_product=hypothetical protein / transcript_product=hypothetical protein / location=Cvel_scaffold1597:26974-34118(-) / protein_length=1246 / sequence_SO=supercontig / SO=protein_coding / is_pseudo=false
MGTASSRAVGTTAFGGPRNVGKSWVYNKICENTLDENTLDLIVKRAAEEGFRRRAEHDRVVFLDADAVSALPGSQTSGRLECVPEGDAPERTTNNDVTAEPGGALVSFSVEIEDSKNLEDILNMSKSLKDCDNEFEEKRLQKNLEDTLSNPAVRPILGEKTTVAVYAKVKSGKEALNILAHAARIWTADPCTDPEARRSPDKYTEWVKDHIFSQVPREGLLSIFNHDAKTINKIRKMFPFIVKKKSFVLNLPLQLPCRITDTPGVTDQNRLHRQRAIETFKSAEAALSLHRQTGDDVSRHLKIYGLLDEKGTRRTATMIHSEIYPSARLNSFDRVDANNALEFFAQIRENVEFWELKEEEKDQFFHGLNRAFRVQAQETGVDLDSEATEYSEDEEAQDEAVGPHPPRRSSSASSFLSRVELENLVPFRSLSLDAGFQLLKNRRIVLTELARVSGSEATAEVEFAKVLEKSGTSALFALLCCATLKGIGALAEGDLTEAQGRERELLSIEEMEDASSLADGVDDERNVARLTKLRELLEPSSQKTLLQGNTDMIAYKQACQDRVAKVVKHDLKGVLEDVSARNTMTKCVNEATGEFRNHGTFNKAIDAIIKHRGPFRKQDFSAMYDQLGPIFPALKKCLVEGDSSLSKCPDKHCRPFLEQEITEEVHKKIRSRDAMVKDARDKAVTVILNTVDSTPHAQTRAQSRSAGENGGRLSERIDLGIFDEHICPEVLKKMLKPLSQGKKKDLQHKRVEEFLTNLEPNLEDEIMKELPTFLKHLAEQKKTLHVAQVRLGTTDDVKSNQSRSAEGLWKRYDRDEHRALKKAGGIANQTLFPGIRINEGKCSWVIEKLINVLGDDVARSVKGADPSTPVGKALQQLQEQHEKRGETTKKSVQRLLAEDMASVRSLSSNMPCLEALVSKLLVKGQPLTLSTFLKALRSWQPAEHEHSGPDLPVRPRNIPQTPGRNHSGIIAVVQLLFGIRGVSDEVRRLSAGQTTGLHFHLRRLLDYLEGAEMIDAEVDQTLESILIAVQPTLSFRNLNQADAAHLLEVILSLLGPEVLEKVQGKSIGLFSGLGYKGEMKSILQPWGTWFLTCSPGALCSSPAALGHFVPHLQPWGTWFLTCSQWATVQGERPSRISDGEPLDKLRRSKRCSVMMDRLRLGEALVCHVARFRGSRGHKSTAPAPIPEHETLFELYDLRLQSAIVHNGPSPTDCEYRVIRREEGQWAGWWEVDPDGAHPLADGVASL